MKIFEVYRTAHPLPKLIEADFYDYDWDTGRYLFYQYFNEIKEEVAVFNSDEDNKVTIRVKE